MKLFTSALAALVVFSTGPTALVALQRDRVPATTPPAPDTPSSSPLAIRGVTVVDVRDGTLLRNQTVVVAGNRIRSVGDAGAVRVPKGARVVEAKGKYLIPGLWDMHAHTEWSEREEPRLQDSLYRAWYPVYIANGVTGIREMAQRWAGGADSFRVWQRGVLTGQRVGPRAIGPSADLWYVRTQPDTTYDAAGKPLITMSMGPRSPDDAATIVDSLAAAGDAFTKIHSYMVDTAMYFAILRQARRAGLPLVGHAPAAPDGEFAFLGGGGVSTVTASDSGQYSIEHLNELHQCWPRFPAPLADSAKADAQCALAGEAFTRNGTWFTPTLVVIRSMLARDPAGWRRVPQYMRLLHRSGVRNLLAGTDCAEEVLRDVYKWGAMCRRGFSLLEEVILLAETGLTPLAALQAATLNPAKYLKGTDSLGTVEAGKLEDLVLLGGNPLEDIRNVTRVEAVVANGRYFDRPALDAMDPERTKLAQKYAGQPAKAGSATP